MTQSTLYTKRGDTGHTDLPHGKRVKKDDHIIDVLGNLDELNCAIGVVRAQDGLSIAIDALLERIQVELFDVAHDCLNQVAMKKNAPCIDEVAIKRLEEEIDHFNATLPSLSEFVLPGGSKVSAHIHLARAICRRTERTLVCYSHHNNDNPLNPLILAYINRLSDWLFVMARYTD